MQQSARVTLGKRRLGDQLRGQLEVEVVGVHSDGELRHQEATVFLCGLKAPAGEAVRRELVAGFDTNGPLDFDLFEAHLHSAMSR